MLSTDRSELTEADVLLRQLSDYYKKYNLLSETNFHIVFLLIKYGT